MLPTASTAKAPLPAGHRFDDAAIAAAKQRLLEAGVTDALGVWTDVHGHPKAKVTPIGCFEKLCRGAELYTVGAVEGLGLAGPHEDECAAVPDPATAVVCPWDPSKAWLHADLWHHGVPYAGDPRGILKRALDRAASMGLRFHLGIEPEFYVLRPDLRHRRAQARSPRRPSPAPTPATTCGRRRRAIRSWSPWPGISKSSVGASTPTTRSAAAASTSSTSVTPTR